MDFALAHALSQAAVFHDLPTAAHNWRVTMYAQAFSEAIDLVDVDTNRFMMGALLHDLGKIDVPHTLLTKPGPLDDEEFECLKQHTCHGYERLLRMGEGDVLILSIVRSHHERLDGSGYPDRLMGSAIPAFARYFAVIDAFDAMTSLRTYRTEMRLKSVEEALEELARDSGTVVCPEATGVLIRLHAEGRLAPIQEHLNDRKALEDLEISAASEACARARLLLRSSTPDGMPDISHLLNAKAG